MALENALVFHPARMADDWIEPPTIPLAVEDVQLQSSDGTRLHAWWCPLKANQEVSETGAMLYCHGNAGNLSHRGGGIPAWQRSLGVPVLIFDYPGYGRSEGKPSEAGCYAAADAAYDWLTKTRGVPPSRLILYGGSLGGAVAVDLASRRPQRALVLVNTFTSIPDVGQMMYPWLPVHWIMRNRFESVAKIGRCQGPVFIAHGDCDEVIPFVLGQRLFAAAHEPKKFLPLAGCSHNDHLGNDFHVALVQFLSEVERKSAEAKPALSSSN